MKNCGPSRDDEYQNINYLVVHLYPLFFLFCIHAINDRFLDQQLHSSMKAKDDKLNYRGQSFLCPLYVSLYYYFFFFFFNEKVLLFLFNPIKKINFFFMK